MNDGTETVRSYPIHRVGGSGARADVDRVSIEEPLEIRVNVYSGGDRVGSSSAR